MAPAVMILMRGKDIGRVGLKVEPVLGPEMARAIASGIWAQNRQDDDEEKKQLQNSHATVLLNVH